MPVTVTTLHLDPDGRLLLEPGGVVRLASDACPGCRCGGGGGGEPCGLPVCFGSCGSCPEAGFSPWRLDESGLGCFGLTVQGLAGCGCCAPPADVAGVAVVRSRLDRLVVDEIEPWLVATGTAPEPPGVECPSGVVVTGWRWASNIDRLTVDRERTIRFVGVGGGLVEILEDRERVRVTRRFSTTVNAGADGVVFETQESDEVVDRGTAGAVVSLGQVYRGDLADGEPLLPQVVAAGFDPDVPGGGCFLGRWARGTLAEGLRAGEASFAASCGGWSAAGFGLSRQSIDIPPVDRGFGVCEPVIPGFAGESVEARRWVASVNLDIGGACGDAAVSDGPGCVGGLAYATVRCDTGAAGPAVCAAWADRVSPRPGQDFVVELDGCCVLVRVAVGAGPAPTGARADGVAHADCARCLAAVSVAMRRCSDGVIDARALRADVELYGPGLVVFRDQAGVCREAVLDDDAAPVDPALPLVTLGEAFVSCDECEAVVDAYECDPCPGTAVGPAGRPVVAGVAPGVVVRIGDEGFEGCWTVSDRAADPAAAVTAVAAFDDCAACLGDDELLYADRLCLGPNCRSPIDLYAPPRITYRRGDRPPGDDTLYLAGACVGFSVCYRATEEVAPAPIVPAAPARAEWRSRLRCSATGAPPACCSACPCGGSCPSPTREDGRPFDLPLPGDLSNFASGGGAGTGVGPAFALGLVFGAA